MRSRARVAAAVLTLTLACFVASVMGRVLLPAPAAARTRRDTHSWLTNNLSDQQQEEEEEDVGEVLLVKEDYQAAYSISEHQGQEERQVVVGRTNYRRGEQQQEERARDGVVRGDYQTATASSDQQRQQREANDDNTFDYLFKSGKFLYIPVLTSV